MRVHADISEARIRDGAVRFEEEKIAIARGEPNERVVRWLHRHQREIAKKRFVIHSTSWRYERAHFVLTYLAYSDDLELDGAREVRVSRLPSASKGRRGRLAVLSHALRHLAVLVAQDPQRYRASLDAAARRQLARLEPAVAGRW